MKVQKLITLVIFLMVAGCASTLNMESNLNGMEGTVISPTFTKGAKSTKEGSMVIYEISIEETECKVIINVDAQSNIMQSWKYHPDSKPCKIISSYGHAW